VLWIGATMGPRGFVVPAPRVLVVPAGVLKTTAPLTKIVMEPSLFTSTPFPSTLQQVQDKVQQLLSPVYTSSLDVLHLNFVSKGMVENIDSIVFVIWRSQPIEACAGGLLRMQGS